MISQFQHIQRRRKILSKSIDVERAFEKWEESCVPSYCHQNPFAAYVSWLRLFKAVNMLRKVSPNPCRVLDFGSSVGELGHLIKDFTTYEFIEQEEDSANFLSKQIPNAVRQTLENAPQGSYDAVFAIDSLEHNANFHEILLTLTQVLAPGGILILSGPTENALYRLGRRIAGFQGEYHLTTIFEIESTAAKHLYLLDVAAVPFGVPLFRITAWRR